MHKVSSNKHLNEVQLSPNAAQLKRKPSEVSEIKKMA